MLTTILSVLVALVSIALIAVVLLQSDKEAGLGALVGNSDSYMSKNGGAKSMLGTITKALVAVWLVLVLSLSLI